MPMLNVFRRDGEVVRHFWGSELLYAPTDPGQDPRHVGTLEPLWNLFDFTPEGRPGDFEEQLQYIDRILSATPRLTASERVSVKVASRMSPTPGATVVSVRLNADCRPCWSHPC